eukprot:CAMPEP_0114053144 /NCGR_PEP_ID=MMETSP1339-20121228/79316_1 /TAXON_ID=94617 /ORGANISM="Fibrocapsa japonica" /LENGTH=38 /assembly_acc=CAM_ASM_000762
MSCWLSPTALCDEAAGEEEVLESSLGGEGTEEAIESTV